LAHNLGLVVVAEGVEDAATLAELGRFGCDYAQGYFIARPCDATQFWASAAAFAEKRNAA
jgi:EAL domain-containing protein (putative c-di-GMP-specific phosphodiesterase class I)